MGRKSEISPSAVVIGKGIIIVEESDWRMVLSILALRGLAGFSGDKWVWLDHDADWIYPNGPTGHLHDVYFNQCVSSNFLFLYDYN